MVLREPLRRTVAPIRISAAATSTKIHSDSPVNGSFVAATVLPRRVVVPRTPPAGFVFVGLSVTTAPFTPPAATGVAAGAEVTVWVVVEHVDSECVLLLGVAGAGACGVDDSVPHLLPLWASACTSTSCPPQRTLCGWLLPGPCSVALPYPACVAIWPAVLPLP